MVASGARVRPFIARQLVSEYYGTIALVDPTLAAN